MNKNPDYLDGFYRKYIANLNKWLPEGIIEVDLALLHRLNLLKFHNEEKIDFSLTRYFHVIESHEKITLINDQFIIWISPERIDDVPITYTLIALNLPTEPHLETGFATWGIYNSSRLVLRVLEKFLLEIQETEDTLHSLK